jgi:hypothetical protein
LVFFYFDINDKAKQTCRSILLSLVLSLTAKSKNFDLLLKKLYEEYDKLYLPTEDGLLDLVKELTLLLMLWMSVMIIISCLIK